MILANRSYSRVIPRDLFNEAKLLKCIGLVSLKILDNMTPVPMLIEDTGEPFEIGLMDDGYLVIWNYQIYIKDRVCTFKTQYNSKSNYPLFCQYEDCEYLVFDEKGNWEPEFIQFCEQLK